MAGLLEVADDEFIRLRDGMKAYSEDVRAKIKENRADDVAINIVSLNEFVSHNGRMCALIGKISKINGAEIRPVSPDNYIEQLKWFGITTIGGLQDMTGRNEERAYELAEKTLQSTDIDILSSNVGLWYVCRAELIGKKYPEEQIAGFFAVTQKDAARAKRQAKRFYEKYIAERTDD